MPSTIVPILPHFKFLDLLQSVRKFLIEVLNSVRQLRCVNGLLVLRVLENALLKML
jgi:hypothetical protein